MEPPPRLSPYEYWGYMITEQHPPQPTPLFTKLLGGIADWKAGAAKANEASGDKIDNMEPKDVKCLTPQKISAFYRAVGGSDLDELFLGTTPARLSEIYTTLGCAHSLQPIPGDDFIPPSIPALTPRGFVIWQTVQLLMDPSEHVPYIRTAVSEFALRDPETGDLFPKEIPPESFPKYPNKETLDWHEDAFARLAAEKARKKEEERVPESTVGAVPSQPGTSARATFDGSEEDWNYRPKRRHASGGDRSSRRHTTHTYDDYDTRYSKSAPGSGREERERSSHRHERGGGGGYNHKHTHSYSHPTSAPRYDLPAENPIVSDIEDDEIYAPPRYPRQQSHSRTRNHPHRHSHPSRHASHSRSREFPKKGYVYTNGDSVPVYTEVPPAEPQLPASYHHAPPPPPPGPSLHPFQSFPNLHTQHAPVEPSPHDDLRSRFLRHRSSSPATRAPLGGNTAAPAEPRRHRHRAGEGLRAQYYRDDDDADGFVGGAAYDDESEDEVVGGWAMADERRRHEDERRKKPSKMRARGVHETVYVSGDIDAAWGGRSHGAGRRGTVPVVYYS
ncbi:hypothetical protein EDC01DRAFT_633503 [Geopyxis carbonaria]|nr:hypothetical protein EDC01DRAFT_633503 [Geopyxis carbonaria]